MIPSFRTWLLIVAIAFDGSTVAVAVGDVLIRRGVDHFAALVPAAVCGVLVASALARWARRSDYYAIHIRGCRDDEEAMS